MKFLVVTPPSIYQKFSTPSNIYPPSPPYRLNSISPHLSTISASLYLSCLSIALLHISVHMYLNSPAVGICIPHLSHLCISFVPSYSTTTLYFQCQYMKFYPSFPGFFALSWHPSTGYSTDFDIHVKYTTYVSIPPPPMSAPLFFVGDIPCNLSM